MLNKLYFPISLALITFLLWSSSNSALFSVKTDEDVEPTILVEYGKFLFHKEKCINCHTLNSSESTKNRISLDGYGGFRSNEYLYTFLRNPKDLVYHSQMPAFSYLHENKLDKNNLKAIVKTWDVDENKSLDFYWESLITQADEIFNGFTDDYSSKPRRTEVLALISFLQQIPRSAYKLEKDSLKNLKRMEEDEKWVSLYSNSDSLINATSMNPDSAIEGAIIFKNYCTACHGEHAEGLIGPNLTDEYSVYGTTNKSIIKVISEGTTSGMPEFRSSLTPIQVGKLVSYLSSIKSTNFPNGKNAQGTK